MEDITVTLEEIEINQVFRDKEKQSTLDEMKISQQANPGNTASEKDHSFSMSLQNGHSSRKARAQNSAS